MSILDLTRPRITWATVDSGFHVGSRDGEFVGYIDTTPDGRFIAFDGQSTPHGYFRSLDQAQASLASAPQTRRAPKARVEWSPTFFAATVSGSLGVGLFALAVVQQGFPF